MGNVLSLGASIGVPLVGGMVIGISMRDEIKAWYPTIKKPSWNPPNWIFGPVWSVLYTLMGYASWRVWKAGGGALPLSLYTGQLVLNFMWSPLFFKVHDLRAASADITALIGLLAATILEFSKVDKLAAQLLLPYLGWTTFAAALTWNIYLNNRQEGGSAGAADLVEGLLSEATAKVSNVFLAQGGEKQGNELPPQPPSHDE